jgi:LytR cell envelope-related transcriptional attenuator
VRRGGRRLLLGLSVGAGFVALGVWLGEGAGNDEGAPSAPVAWSQGRVRVEVLNAGGVSGMARAATRALREAGFDVVQFGNAATFDEARPSEVIDRVGRADIAQVVAEALGIDNVQSDPDPNLYVDVSVLLGSEWAGKGIDFPVDEPAEARPWWDSRGWFGR